MFNKKILSLAVALSLSSCCYAAPLSQQDIERLSQPHQRLFYLVSATVDFNIAEQIKRAYNLMENDRDYPMAIAVLDKVIELDGKNAEACLLRGIAKTRQAVAGEHDVRDYNRADEDYKAALLIEPDNPTFFFYRGENYRLAGHYQRCRDTYKLALELAPNYLDAMVGIGDAYFDEAESQMNRWHKNGYQGDGWHYDELAVRNYERAINEYNKALVLVPEHGVIVAKKELAQEKLTTAKTELAEKERQATIARRIG